MRILFDKSAPYGLARDLEGHDIATAEERGWGRLENGILLNAAEEAGFDVFFTADKNLRYQQNLSGRKTSLVVLGNSLGILCVWHVMEIAAINAATPGFRREIERQRNSLVVFVTHADSHGFTTGTPARS